MSKQTHPFQDEGEQDELQREADELILMPVTYILFSISKYTFFKFSKIFIWDHYSCEMGYIKFLKVMIKGKYLIVGHMWWRSPVVGKGTREAEVMGSNPANNRENRTRAYSRDLQLLFILNIFILTRKIIMPSPMCWYRWRANMDARHLCVT